MRLGEAGDGARATVDYRGGSGRVTLTADGHNGVPFRIAADAQLTPDLYRVGAQGMIKGIALKLAAPAVIRKVGEGYQLQPTTLLLPQGRVDMSGPFGKSSSLSAASRTWWRG